MRLRRSFRPSACEALEGRVVLSHVSLPGAAIRPVSLSPAQIAQSNASEASFPLSPSATIHAGTPVAEQLTTTYSDGSTQTESLLRVPNPSNNTVTTYETIQLRNNGGTETVVDTESFSGGPAPFSGTDNTHAITTTLPDGSIQTETYDEVITGNKTAIAGTIHEANGGVQTWTSTKIKHGPRATTNKTVTEANGTIEHEKIVTTSQGDLDSTASSTTRTSSSLVRSSSATNVIRVQPPASTTGNGA